MHETAWFLLHESTCTSIIRCQAVSCQAQCYDCIEHRPHMFRDLVPLYFFLFSLKKFWKIRLRDNIKWLKTRRKYWNTCRFSVILSNINKCSKCMQLPKRTTLNKMLCKWNCYSHYKINLILLKMSLNLIYFTLDSTLLN